jgi:excisionase family DNA binding protein
MTIRRMMSHFLEGRSIRLARVSEACEYAAMGRTRLYSKLAEGVIKARKHGGQTLIDLDSLDRYLETLPEWTPVEARITRGRPTQGGDQKKTRTNGIRPNKK